MKEINITNARKNLYNLVAETTVGFNPIKIVNNKGKNAVLISEDEWRGMEETLYFESIPGFIEKTKKIDAETDWEHAERYDPNKKW